MPEPRHTAEETARLGDEIYEQRVRAQVEAGHKGKIVAIDVDTGDYAIGETVIGASKDLLAKKPSAELWFVRVGHRALHRIGARPLSEVP